MRDVSLHVDHVDILLEREAEVATSNDNAVRLVNDLVDVGETFETLDFRVNADVVASGFFKHFPRLFHILDRLDARKADDVSL